MPTMSNALNRETTQPSAVDALADAPLKTMQGARGPGAVSAFARDDFERDIWCVLGVPVDTADVPTALEAVEAAVRDGARLSFVTPNVNWLVRALKDRSARAQIVAADLSLADGAPVAALAKLVGAPIRSRAAGSDLFDALRQRSALRSPLKVFFFGGRDGAAEAAHAAVNADAGGVTSVGWLNPGFGDVEAMSRPEVIDEINAAGADFVIVSLGAAKGQDWIERNQERLNAAVVAHLGAVVDFTAGTVARAPRWMARSGLEWAWRIIADGALWRRYASDGWALVNIAARRLPRILSAGRRSGVAEPARASLERADDEIIIALEGDLVHGGLGRVRRAFREAAASGAAPTLDLADAGAIDAAFLGLVLMLEKHCVRAGRRLSLANPSRRAIRLFRANAMDYPIIREAGKRRLDTPEGATIRRSAAS